MGNESTLPECCSFRLTAPSSDISRDLLHVDIIGMGYCVLLVVVAKGKIADSRFAVQNARYADWKPVGAVVILFGFCLNTQFVKLSSR